MDARRAAPDTDIECSCCFAPGARPQNTAAPRPARQRQGHAADSEGTAARPCPIGTPSAQGYRLHGRPLETGRRGVRAIYRARRRRSPCMHRELYTRAEIGGLTYIAVKCQAVVALCFSLQCCHRRVLPLACMCTTSWLPPRLCLSTGPHQAEAERRGRHMPSHDVHSYTLCIRTLCQHAAP
jgi:hypothetical protein